MNENQKRQIEEARRESMEKTMNVGADGEKHNYEPVCNQIDNE